MPDFPSAIYSPRTMVNRPGVVYDLAQTKRIYAEDFNLDRAEIVAIETTLGEDPQGVFDTVVERLDDIDDEIASRNIIDGDAVGQVAVWDGDDWVNTETDEMSWDFVNKTISLGRSGATTHKIHIKGTEAGDEAVEANAPIYLEDSDGIPRHALYNSGIAYWDLSGTDGEKGRIAYSTPSGYPGIVIFRGSRAGGFTNRFDLINVGSYFNFRFNADTIGKGIKVYPGGNVIVGGSIASGQMSDYSTAGPTDNLNVSGVNTIMVNTGSNNVTIGGLTGGVAGQVIHIVKLSPSNNLTIEYGEAGNDQKIYLSSGGDETITGVLGGFVLVCNGGSSWYGYQI